MGISDSLSLPSEPPDIGNWFSSYVYESPELNTVDGFKDSNGSMVAETEESPSESRQNLSGNIILTRNAHLLLDGKGTSDVVINCKNPNRDDNYISEVFKYSDSSLCSEPPDIKKWFSSYVYESPVLDTSYEFRSGHKENESYEQGNDAKIGSEEKELALSNSPRNGKDDFEGENMSSDGLVECINFLEDKENEDPYIPKDSQKANGNQNSAKLNNLTTRWSMDQTLQKETMQDKGNGSAKDLVITRSSLDKLSSEFNPEVSPVFLNIKCGSHKKRGESAQESTLRRDLREENSNAGDLMKGIDIIVSAENLEFNRVEGKPVKKTGPSVDKQNNTEFTETGFISTRKSSRRVDEENYFKGPIDVKSDTVENGVIISPCKSKEAISRRKVLSESTNLQPFNVIEVTGKWRCRQKSKPNLGPPLKQLRLEQWVHRL